LKHDFGKKLRERQAILALSDAAVARKLGISTRRYNNYAVGLREPPFYLAAQICDTLLLDAADLIGSKRHSADTSTNTRLGEIRVSDQKVDVRSYVEPMSSGKNFRSDNPMLTQYTWLKRITSLPAENLRLVEVNGDSMHPFINAGDQLLVDTTQQNPRHDGIYVIEWDGIWNVKRVTADPTTRTVTISSDNIDHSSVANVSPDAIKVVGRVIWVARRA
jgi:phage repressor protein C with HTH and peptisase S24 domain